MPRGGTRAILSPGMNELVEKLRAQALLWSGRKAIVGALEHPPNLHAYNAWIAVRGWALGLDARSAITIVCLVDNKIVHRATPDRARPDISELFPALPAAARCGFETRLTISVLPWH